MGTNVKEINAVNVIDRTIIDNFLFFPENDVDRICSYLGMFLISKCSNFSFNIEGKRKTLSIVKDKENSTIHQQVYLFKYHNRTNGYRVFYERYVTGEAIYDLYVECLKILKANN